MTVPIDAEALHDNVSVLPGQHERDEMAVPSYTHWNPVVRWLFRSRLEHAVELLAPTEGDRVLDFGSGSGVLLPTLSAGCAHVYASDIFIEPAQRMVERRGLDNVTVIDSALPTLDDLGGAPLDAIVALDVLEHVDDVDEVAGRFMALLKPEGRLITSAPTETAIYKLGRKLAGFGDKGHYHHTDAADIDQRLEAGGFQADETRRLFRAPLPHVFSLRRFVCR